MNPAPVKPRGIVRRKHYYSDTQRIMVDIDTGEQSVQLPVEKSIEITKDSVGYTKVFSDLWNLLPKLNAPGIKLLAYIGNTLQRGSDTIVLDKDDFLEWAQLSSHVVFYNGVKNLMAHEVIFKSNTRNLYYLNVNLLFNGDRTQLIK